MWSLRFYVFYTTVVLRLKKLPTKSRKNNCYFFQCRMVQKGGIPRNALTNEEPLFSCSIICWALQHEPYKQSTFAKSNDFSAFAVAFCGLPFSAFSMLKKINKLFPSVLYKNGEVINYLEWAEWSMMVDVPQRLFPSIARFRWHSVSELFRRPNSRRGQSPVIIL
jgi:hypothetical protein